MFRKWFETVAPQVLRHVTMEAGGFEMPAFGVLRHDLRVRLGARAGLEGRRPVMEFSARLGGGAGCGGGAGLGIAGVSL